jgi:hypothetical protein
MGSRGTRRLWASIFTYCALSLVFDVAILIAHAHSLKTWRNTYWTWQIIAAILRLWVLGDVLANFPGSEVIGDRTRWFCGTVAVVFAGFAATLALHDPRGLQAIIKPTAIVMDHTVSWAWGAFLVIVLFHIWGLRLGWDCAGGRIITGLAIKVGASVLVSDLLYFKLHLVLANLLEAFSALLCLWFWLIAVSDTSSLPDVAIFMSQRTLPLLEAKQRK